jgi:hypothetical protein
MATTTTHGPTYDYRRELGDLYAAGDHPVMVEVPSISFLMIDGHGDPDASPAFKEAVEALYAVAYALKFRMRSLPDGIDAAIMPLEGLWWIPDARVWDFGDKSDWNWTLMLAEPDLVTPALAAETIDAVRTDRGLPALERMRFETLPEGRAAQILHRGPFSAERPTLERLYDFIREQGSVPVGKHHEIYLSDPQRTAPAHLRTIIRQPVAPAASRARNR